MFIGNDVIELNFFFDNFLRNDCRECFILCKRRSSIRRFFEITRVGKFTCFFIEDTVIAFLSACTDKANFRTIRAFNKVISRSSFFDFYPTRFCFIEFSVVEVPNKKFVVVSYILDCFRCTVCKCNGLAVFRKPVKLSDNNATNGIIIFGIQIGSQSIVDV